MTFNRNRTTGGVKLTTTPAVSCGLSSHMLSSSSSYSTPMRSRKLSTSSLLVIFFSLNRLNDSHYGPIAPTVLQHGCRPTSTHRSQPQQVGQEPPRVADRIGRDFLGR